ncbi:MAG TPA: MarR family transcriptional regulator [Planctomycetota bacterium]
MGRTADVRRDFVELWGSLGGYWGIPPATARVYAWLLSQAEPCGAEAIVEGLGMSRGAVSMAARELRDWGLVHVERVPGSRQALYRAETDLEVAIRNIVRTRKRREWDPLLARLRAWIEELARERGAEAETFRERLGAIEALVGMADSMADSFLKGGMVQKLGLKVLVASARRQGRRRSGP